MMAAQPVGSVSRRWWVAVAASAGVAIATALVAGLLMVPEEAPSRDAAPATGDLGTMAAAALESIGLDSTRVLGMRRELEAAFERRRDELPQEATSSVDASLALLDRQIAELSTALEQDPGNPELARLLASAYRRQVEMLRTVDRVGPAREPSQEPPPSGPSPAPDNAAGGVSRRPTTPGQPAA